MPEDARTFQSQVDDTTYGAFHRTTANGQLLRGHRGVIQSARLGVAEEVVPLPTQFLANSPRGAFFDFLKHLLQLPLQQATPLPLHPLTTFPRGPLPFQAGQLVQMLHHMIEIHQLAALLRP